MAELLTPFAGSAAKELALALLDRFGTLGQALTVEDRRLRQAIGQHKSAAELIIAARKLILAALHENVSRATVRIDDPNFIKYLILKMRGKPHEELHALFVDHDRGFIAEELIASGTSRVVESRIRPIIARAIELDAAGLYLIHNHPSNQPDPSMEDVLATKALKQICSSLELELFDHLIVAGNRVTSMQKLGLL